MDRGQPYYSTLLKACPRCYSKGCRRAEDPRVVKISALAKEHNATRLVIRFEKTTRYAAKVGLLGLVGWTNLPIIRLGPALD